MNPLGRTPTPLSERFWAQVCPEPMSGCWLWSGAPLQNTGYGRIRVGQISKRAHRVSYELNIGVIPQGLSVLHRCDVPSCVNPRHLFLGTLLDNNRDRDAKGRNGLAKRTHCPAGDPYDGINTYHRLSRIGRMCKACGVIAKRKRGMGGIANAKKTHCIHGHAFDELNTYITKVGKRMCRKCNKIRSDRKKAML